MNPKARQFSFRKLGIVGGIGWMATRLYYTELCRRSAILLSTAEGGAANGHATMEIVIESLNLDRGLAPSVPGPDAWDGFDRYHRDALIRLEQAGAELAIIASNTPHERFAAITQGIGVPVINLFEVLARHCNARRHAKVLVLGTHTTMRSGTLAQTLNAHGTQVLSPPTAAQRCAVVELIEDIQAHGARHDDAARLARLVNELQRQEPVDAVVLACTELPLAFPGRESLLEFEHAGVVYINSAIAHVEAVLQAAFEPSRNVVASARATAALS